MSASPLTPMIHKLERRARLDDRDRKAILALPHTLRLIETGAYIVREGDRAERSCLLSSGFAYRHKIVRTGDRQILSFHMRGDLVDLQNSLLRTADHSVQALTQVEATFMPREALKELARNYPAIAEAMWIDTLLDGAIFREWIANVGRRNARTRISHLLCEFAMRLEEAGLGERTSYLLPMTQEHIADATGLTSVHVNRSLMVLETDGLIKREKRFVSIPDWRKLQKAADFQTGYLHLDLEDAA
jgi:CRP-like cAMP-binding protein